MAKHGIRANKTPAKPKSEIRAAKSFYEKTHPVGSAERFLDEAAKEALAAAAAGGVITPKGAAIGAAKAVADEMDRYPDPLLAEAAKLSRDELAKRAARAAIHQRAMEAQNAAVRVASAVSSPVGNMVANNAALTADEVLGTRQAVDGGDSVSEISGSVPENPGSVPENPGSVSAGPRIVINPTTFTNKKDALCVAFNEGFRLWMEATGFEPQSEPTDAQRRFFSDTAYADDELQLRRTILARIATFDTSVKDPTDEQLAETGSFLDAILESDWCKNEWERNAVSRLSQAVKASVGAEPVEPRQEPLEAREAEPLQMRAAMGGGETEDEDEDEDEDETPAQEPVQEADNKPGTTGEGANEGEGYTLTSGSGEVVNYNKDGTLQEPEQPGPSGAPESEIIAALDWHMKNADALGKAVDNWNRTTDQILANGEQLLADIDKRERTQPQDVPAQNAPAKESAEEKPVTDWDIKLQAAGLHSGVFKTMADGSQRELTGTEAAALRRRIDSGASVSGRQLAMFGLSRNERGQLVSTETAGSADAGSSSGDGGTPAITDAGLDRVRQEPFPKRRSAAKRRS